MCEASGVGASSRPHSFPSTPPSGSYNKHLVLCWEGLVNLIDMRIELDFNCGVEIFDLHSQDIFFFP